MPVMLPAEGLFRRDCNRWRKASELVFGIRKRAGPAGTGVFSFVFPVAVILAPSLGSSRRVTVTATSHYLALAYRFIGATVIGFIKRPVHEALHAAGVPEPS